MRVMVGILTPLSAWGAQAEAWNSWAEVLVVRTMSCCSETGASSRPASAASRAFGAFSWPCDGDRCQPADALAVQTARGRPTNAIDGGAGARDGRGRAAQGVGLLIDDDAAVVDHEHVLEQVAHLVDEVGREDDGARVLGVVLEQAVVEDLPGDGVEAEVGLVEEGERGARGEADDHADRRELAAGELLDRAGSAAAGTRRSAARRSRRPSS